MTQLACFLEDGHVKTEQGGRETIIRVEINEAGNRKAMQKTDTSLR